MFKEIDIAKIFPSFSNIYLPKLCFQSLNLSGINLPFHSIDWIKEILPKGQRHLLEISAALDFDVHILAMWPLISGSREELMIDSVRVNIIVIDLLIQ